MTSYNDDKFASSGTNIDEVKRKNAASGLSYNQIKQLLAQTGGYGSAINGEEIAKEFHQEIDESNKK